jgi:hypothetical protein
MDGSPVPDAIEIKFSEGLELEELASGSGTSES